MTVCEEYTSAFTCLVKDYPTIMITSGKCRTQDDNHFLMLVLVFRIYPGPNMRTKFTPTIL